IRWKLRHITGRIRQRPPEVTEPTLFQKPCSSRPSKLLRECTLIPSLRAYRNHVFLGLPTTSTQGPGSALFVDCLHCRRADWYVRTFTDHNQSHVRGHTY